MYDAKQHRDVRMATSFNVRGLVTNSRLQHGIFACWDCTQSEANSVDVRRFKKDRVLFEDLLHPIEESRAIFAIYANHPFVWRTNAKACPTLEHPAGEPIGPLVTYERVVSLGGAAAGITHNTVVRTFVLIFSRIPVITSMLLLNAILSTLTKLRIHGLHHHPQMCSRSCY